MLSRGQLVTLSGTIASDSLIVSVSITVTGEVDKQESSMTMPVNALLLDLSTVDAKMLFSSLSDGEKMLVLAASDVFGAKTLGSYSFTVIDSPYCWPVPQYSKISSRYGEYRGTANRIIPYHYAIDIAAKKGSPIYACASGKVVDFYNQCKHRGPCRCGHDCGNHIEILSDAGEVYKIRYSHMTTVLVTLGQSVVKGQKIGTVGNTGRSTGSHLDLKFSDKNDQPINPEPYFTGYIK